MLGTFLAALVFAAACNLDTVILAMGYGMRGVRLTAAQTMVIGGITTLVTWMSLVLGDTAAMSLGRRLPPRCWTGSAARRERRNRTAG